MPELPAPAPHSPVELNLHDVACITGGCEHAAGHCPVIGRAIACDTCTYDNVDLGVDDVVAPYPWPCQHTSGGETP